jgi:CBS domain-containing protein
LVLYARDILDKDFLLLEESATIFEAAKLMNETRHGFVVIGPVSNPKGIVTEWDIISKVVAQGKDPTETKLGDIMSTEMMTVTPDTAIAKVSQIMSEKAVRRLLVKKGDEVIGFVTSKTVLARLNDYVDKVSAQIGGLQGPSF